MMDLWDDREEKERKVHWVWEDSVVEDSEEEEASSSDLADIGRAFDALGREGHGIDRTVAELDVLDEAVDHVDKVKAS